MEENKQRKFSLRWIFGAIPALIATVFIIYLIASHYVLTNVFAIIAIVGAILLAAFAVMMASRAERKKSAGFAASIFSLVMTVIMVGWCFIGSFFIADRVWKAEGDKALQLYSEVYYGEFLPSVSELKETEDTEILYYRDESIFSAESYTLICTYNESEFSKKSAESIEKHNLTSPTEQYENFEIYNIPTPDENNGYYFVCKLLINQQTKQIAYVVFKSGERPPVEDDIEGMLNNDCGWKYF